MAITKVRGEQLNAELLDLNDTPSSYSGMGSRLVIVKAAEDGIDFDTVGNVVPTVTWVNDIYTSNGTLRQYTLSFTPQASSISIDLEGMALTEGASNDWTISGKVLTLTGGVPIENGMKIDVHYVTGDQQYGSGMPDWVIVDSGPTALVTWSRYMLDSSGGTFTINLPATPTKSDTIHLMDYTGNAAANNITVGRNGSNIMGVADDLVIDTDDANFSLVYSDATNGWRIVD